METGRPVEGNGSEASSRWSLQGSSDVVFERVNEGLSRGSVEKIEVEERLKGGGFRAFFDIRDEDAAEKYRGMASALDRVSRNEVDNAEIYDRNSGWKHRRRDI